MYLLLFSLLLFTSPLQEDPRFMAESRMQAEFYLQQIEENKEVEEHLWALITLGRSNPEIRSHINHLLEGGKFSSVDLDSLSGNYTDNLQRAALRFNSERLLIALLLEESDPVKRKEYLQNYLARSPLDSEHGINFSIIAEKIINKEVIGENELPVEYIDFVHFQLFFNYYENISREYLSKAVEKWAAVNFSTNSLLSSMETATYLRGQYTLDNYAKIGSVYSPLIDEEFLPNSDLKLKIYRYLDYSMYRLGFYDRSLEITNSYTIPLANYLGNKNLVLSLKINQGSYLYQIGKIKESQKMFLEVQKQAEEMGVSLPQSLFFNNLAITYLKEGDFDQYLNLQFKALEVAKSQNSYSRQLEILTNLYIYYRQNKDLETSLEYLEKGRELASEFGETDDLGLINLNTAIIYRDFEENYKIAEKYFSEAKQQLDAKNNYRIYVMYQFEQAQLFEETQRPEKAQKIYDQIITQSKERDDNKNLLSAYIYKSEILLNELKLSETKKYISLFSNENLEQLNFEDIVKARTIEARYYIQTGQAERAHELLQPVIQRTVEWARNSTDIQAGFWNVEPEFIDAFQVMADLQIQTGRNEEAVETLDQLKTINDAALYQNPMVKSSLLNESELTQYRQLTNQLNALRKQQLLADEQQKQDNIRSRIDQLSAQKSVLDRKISRLVDQSPVSVNEVQSDLSGHEMVLHITELNNRYYIAQISRRDVEFKKVELDSTLRSLFENSVQNLSIGKTDLNQLYRISQILDFQSIPEWINTITVIPDSYLYQLPIDILPVSQPDFSYSYGETEYLIESFNTNYMTSLNDFREPVSKSSFKRDFAGYGVSNFDSYGKGKDLVALPYAQNEVDNIVDELSNLEQKAAYLNESSSEQTFKETAPESRILHLATHSELSDRDPLFSTIYMNADSASSDEELSGRIFAYELFELDLANDLIMLNSCESGSGTYLQGSGIMGISRALRYAGANSLVLNLWSVNDMMASEFAVQFYKNINSGKSKAEALRLAKLHFLKEKNANPHFWGPYMLIGNKEAVVRPFERMNTYVAASFLLYFITLVSIIFFRQRNGE